MTHRCLCLLLALAALVLCGPPTHAEPPSDPVVPRLTYTTTWIGNSFPGTAVPGLRNRKHVQLGAEALFVAPDGTCYLNSNWDEDGYEAGIYRNGDVVGNCDDLHGWGRSGGKAICASDKYIYVAMSQRGDDGGNYPAKNQYGQYQYPPKDRIWRCVRRYDLKGNPAPFPGGSGHDGSMLIIKESQALSADEAEEYGQHLQSILGVNYNEVRNRLYVCTSFPGDTRTIQYNAATMEPTNETLDLSAFRPLAYVHQLAVGERGDIWALVVQMVGESRLPYLVHFGADGKMVGKKSEVLPIATEDDCSMSLDEKRNRLLLIDRGNPSQQILVFDISSESAHLKAKVGVADGIFAGVGPEIGRDGPKRFNNPVGAGCDQNGNLYVACSGSVDGGGTVLESYASNATGTGWGSRIWRLIGLEFVDGGDFDPSTDGRDLYTKEEHFTLDLTKSTGQDVTYTGYTAATFNAQRYAGFQFRTKPATAFFRRINGKPILYTTDMYVGPLTISRFDRDRKGEIAIPCGCFDKGNVRAGESPPLTAASIRHIGDSPNDQDKTMNAPDGKAAPTGWGWCVDSHGDIWQATDREGIRHFPVGGLDAHGSPIYSFATMQTLPMPAPLTELCRAEYVAETDTMFLTGYTTDHPHTGGEWGAVGTEVLRFDGWKIGNRTPSLRIPLLYDGQKDPKLFIKSLSVAGDYVFAAEGRDPERIFVYDAHTGKLQGTLQPDATVGSHSGWIDHPYAIRAFRRKSGEYLVLAEEDLDAKLILYRWTPPK